MSNWVKTFAALVFASILAIPCLANDPAGSFIPSRHERVHPIGRIWHYVVTHKEVLAADALASSAWLADSASTVYDEHHCTCIETNPILGKHPSEGAVWGYGIGSAALFTTLNHLIWHYAPDRSDRHLFWFEVAPIIGVEASNVYSNVHAADISPLPQLHSNARSSYGLLAAPPQSSVRKMQTPMLSSGSGNLLVALRADAIRAASTH